MDSQIRKATVEDLAVMLAIMEEALEGHASTSGPTQEQLDRWVPRFSNPDIIFYVMVDSNTGLIIGWARGGKVSTTHKLTPTHRNNIS